MVSGLEHSASGAGAGFGGEVLAPVLPYGGVGEYGSGESGCEGGAVADLRWDGATFGAGPCVSNAGREESSAPAGHP